MHSDGTVLRGQPHLRGRPGSFAWIDHNPGNIKVVAKDLGQYPGRSNWHDYLIFPSHDVGFAAIGTLLRGPDYANLTLLLVQQKIEQIAGLVPGETFPIGSEEIPPEVNALIAGL